jgi:opacity protein-like surface antigen
VALIALIPRVSLAQTPPAGSWRPEVSAGIGLGHVARYEDRTFGDRPNLMGGFALLHRRGFGIEAEISRTLGLSPEPAPCGILFDGLPATCLGTAHEGVRSATVVSLNGRYEFKAGRFRPYVTAGLGVLRSTSVWSTAVVQGRQVLLSEEELRDTGFGPDLGAGLRVALTPNVSISPEIRWLDASLRSRVNLSVTRVSVRAAYAW